MIATYDTEGKLVAMVTPGCLEAARARGEVALRDGVWVVEERDVMRKMTGEERRRWVMKKARAKG